MNYQKVSGCVVLALGMLLAACSTQSEPAKLSVVASIRPLTLMVEQLAGNLVAVQTLLPANADPHNMALRISDRSRLEQADLVVWLGPEFEQFLLKPMAQRHPQGQLILGNLAQLNWPTEQHNHHHDDHAGEGRDMHLWLDPENAKVVITAIFHSLVVLQPDLSEQLTPRLAEVLRDVERARQQIRQQLNPLATRGFGVDHNAYGHFVAAFGLRQMAAVNEIPGQRMSAKQRHQLHQQLDGAVCFVVEREALPSARLAAALQLPVVIADPLASDPALTTYSEFLLSLGDAFYRCLAGD